MTHDPMRIAPGAAAQQPLPGTMPLAGGLSYPQQPVGQPAMGQPNRGQSNMGQPNIGQPAMGHPTMGHRSSGHHAPLPPLGEAPPSRRAPGGPTKRKKPARPTTARPRRNSGPSKAYVAMWAAMAGISIAYLAVITVKPDVMTAMGVTMIPGNPESNHGQRFTAKLVSDVQTLQQSVTELQGEITALRTGAPLTIKAAAQGADWLTVDARPAEQRLPDPKLQARLGTPLDGTRVAGMVITSPGPAAQANLPSGPVPSGPVGLELVTGPSVDALRLNWGVLAERHGATLKNLEVKYAAGGPNGPFQLLAGPVASAEEGFRICEQFRAKGTPCKVGPFQGQGF
jgi:hypothetical protein